MRRPGETVLRDVLVEHVLSDDVLVSWVPPWHDLGLVRFIIETRVPRAPLPHRPPGGTDDR